jgi:hypothetical protein
VFSTSSGDYQYEVETNFNTTSLYAISSVGADGADDIALADLTGDDMLTSEETDDDIFVTNARLE